MSNLEMILKPKAKDLGDDFVVRRSLPSLKKKMVGPFVFWDHMGPVELTPERGMVVHGHPHIGLSTITYLFSGEIVHRDSLGNQQVIRPGEVNWMTAGKGIAHSERSQPVNGTLTLEGIQLWLALPVDAEGVEPSFVHYKEEKLPLIELEGYHLRLIAGQFLEESSPLPVYSSLFYLSCRGEKGKAFSYQLKNQEEGAVYLVKGQLLCEGQEVNPYETVVFRKGARLEVIASELSEFMIFGGEVFPEPRHIWWNFVASNKKLIEEAKSRWKKGKFSRIPNENEYIPLPDK